MCVLSKKNRSFFSALIVLLLIFSSNTFSMEEDALFENQEENSAPKILTNEERIQQNYWSEIAKLSHNKEPQYCWNLFHWAWGIYEYSERCFCCKTEIDSRRQYSLKNKKNDTVETTDCCCICFVGQFGIFGCCDNPLTGTLCCPLVTLSHILCIPLVVCLDGMGICCKGECNKRYTTHSNEIERAIHTSQEESRIRSMAYTHAHKPTASSPLTNNSDSNAIAAEASKREVAERNARYDALKRQQDENRARDQQRQRDYKNHGTWS